MNRFFFYCLQIALIGATSFVLAQDVPTEEDYYTIQEVPIPKDAYLEVGALEILGNKLYASSRRGDIYSIDGAMGDDLPNAKFKKFAGGLHEVLGLSALDGKIYATQRCEVTRLSYDDHDGRADLFETISDDWGINGDYHEYAFGSKFDRNGDMWIVLCLTGSFVAADESPYRGWCLRLGADGKMRPTCSGIRSPGGIGMNHVGDVFYTDNQGPWNGTCGLKWLRPGSFQGNPSGNKFYSLTDEIGVQPPEPKSGSRIMDEAKTLVELEPTAILFPYKKMGQSASGIACDLTKGNFGPFKNQLFVGDQTQSTVMRVFLEKVQGHYQGACFPFKKGFGSGSLALKFSENGKLFVGSTNRGWGSTGRKPYALERLDWTGKTPFEIHEMRAKKDGFELTFTEPVDEASATDPSSYKIETYTYIYQSSYGSPEVDHSTPKITNITVADDGLSVQLVIDGLREGHVHELHTDGLRSVKRKHPVLHPVAYYTLNYIPE